MTMMFRREGTRELLLGRIGARQNIYDTGTKGRSPSKEAFVRVRTGMREFIYLESDSSSPKDSDGRGLSYLVPALTYSIPSYQSYN